MLNLFENKLFPLTIPLPQTNIVTNQTACEEEGYEKDNVHDGAGRYNHDLYLFRTCHAPAFSPHLICHIEEEGEKRELSPSRRVRTSDAASPMANPVREPEARRNGR